ncbi:MAG: hypothetical protein F6J86_36095 [Symploca sp. SIO1B1]|nr:hypothetical protein [Symploca sp. SIO1C2]NER99190.1 hypothetical protein [Symploca sp. SIO1B1]
MSEKKGGELGELGELRKLRKLGELGELRELRKLGELTEEAEEARGAEGTHNVWAQSSRNPTQNFVIQIGIAVLLVPLKRLCYWKIRQEPLLSPIPI